MDTPLPPLRLAISTEHFRRGVGGGENIAMDVVDEMRRRGHSVMVCAVTGDDPIDFARIAPEDTPEYARACGVDLLVDWGVRMNADVHYMHGGPHGVFLRYSAMTVPAWLRPFKRLEFALKPKHRKTVAEQAAFFAYPEIAYLAVSDFVAGQVAEVVPSGTDIRTLYNPVDTRRFSPENRRLGRDAARARFGIAEDAVVFVWVAHNPGLKNLKLLLRIFPEVRRRAPNAVLLVVGKRRPRKRADWLVYAGAVERPEEVYAASDALVHPTFYDTFANVVTEAMACGLPVLCSDRAGAAEVMRGVECGEVLPVVGEGIGRLWCESIVRLALSPVLREALGAEARRVAETMDFQAYADRLEAEFRRFAAQKKRAGGSDPAAR